MDIGVYISELSKSSQNIIKIISENGVDIYPINELGLLKYPPQKSIVFIDLTINANEHLKWMSMNKVKENSYNVIVITPRNSELVAQAMHQGAIDYLHPPFSIQQIKNILNRAFEHLSPGKMMIASSWKSKQVLQLAQRAANTDATILLTGESGTGKEVLAKYIHQYSSRRDEPFISVNCAAIPETMLEAILFGHLKGAFTGAIQNQKGKFEEAQNGTLLLDEIAEMSLTLQAKLLRVLQEKEVDKIGSGKPIKLNVRVIASTNKDLRQAVKDNKFREDLYYRLDVLPIQWLPLRERKEDIIPLAYYFIEKYVEENEVCELSRESESLLTEYHWPGNIRELENTIQRAIILRHSAEIYPEDLNLPIASISMNSNPLETDCIQSQVVNSKKLVEFRYILDELKKSKGNRTITAKSLGISTRALRYKLADMKSKGIDINFKNQVLS